MKNQLTEKKFLQIIACPICKNSLIKKRNKVYCKTCKKSYKIKDKIFHLIENKSLNKIHEELNAQKVEIERYDSFDNNPAMFKLFTYWKEKMIINERGLVLDLGCGNGKFSEFINHKDIVGIEPSEDFLNQAKKRLNFLVRAVAENIPFKDSSFDTVYISNALHHLKEPKIAINEIARILKPHGKLIVQETNKSFFNALLRKIIYKFHPCFSKDHKNFKLSELKNLLEEKFDIKNITHTGYFCYTYCLTNLLIKCNNRIMDICIKLDKKIIPHLPWIRTQSWHVTIKTEKKTFN